MSGAVITPATSPRGAILRRLAEPPLLALGFLTIVPINLPWTVSPRALSRAAALFPAVGLLLGGAVALADLTLRRVLPVGPVSAIDLLLLTTLSGGLHLDGLMDWCDGVFLSGGPERRLAVLRDSRVGSFGVLGAVLTLLLEYSALSSLAGPARTLALLLVPAVARWSLVLPLWAFPYARTSGAGTPFKEGIGLGQVLVATALAALALALLHPHDLVLLPLAGLTALSLGWWTASRLGGLTGDSYGAASELVTALLLVFLAGGWR